MSELLSSELWRLAAALLAIVLIAVALTAGFSSSGSRFSGWIRGRRGGVALTGIFLALVVSAGMTSRMAPLPPYGKERELQQQLAIAEEQIEDLRRVVAYTTTKTDILLAQLEFAPATQSREGTQVEQQIQKAQVELARLNRAKEAEYADAMIEFTKQGAEGTADDGTFVEMRVHDVVGAVVEGPGGETVGRIIDLVDLRGEEHSLAVLNLQSMGDSETAIPIRYLDVTADGQIQLTPQAYLVLLKEHENIDKILTGYK